MSKLRILLSAVIMSMMVTFTSFARTPIQTLEVQLEYNTEVPTEKSFTAKSLTKHAPVRTFKIMEDQQLVDVLFCTDNSEYFFGMKKYSAIHTSVNGAKELRIVKANRLNDSTLLHVIYSWDEMHWMNDDIGTTLVWGDGTRPKSQWFMYEGKWYYFNDNGYILKNTTTPDGYPVDENGVYYEGTP